MTSFYGDGSCIDGVVCLNDAASIVLADMRGKFIGSKTGCLGFAVDGYGFSSNLLAQVTQFGYPSGIDYGNWISRSDSPGEVWDDSLAYNTIIGSPLNDGSSGGPWVANLGNPRFLMESTQVRILNIT